MRPIGQLETEEQARTFADYLFIRDIETQVEPGKGNGWTLWVIDEDRVDESQALLSRFRSMPDAEEFYQAPQLAAARRRDAAHESRKEEKTLKRAAAFPWRMRGGGLTMALLVACVAVGLATQLGQNSDWTGWLLLSLERVQAGQAWRLFTPALLHFSLWHLLFNLLWLQDLGTVLETKLGTARFAAVVGLVAVLSNVAQYAAGGAGFGGMSGVIYGLFGYLWVRGKRDFRFGVVLSPMTSGLLMVFLALGIFGLLGPTANAAHFSGLVVGGALGWLAAQRNAKGNF
ncbi:MAG: rhomboid family intramembrane serine protease [Kiritimatiellia bacterium]